jgi:hypothetical protein
MKTIAGLLWAAMLSAAITTGASGQAPAPARVVVASNNVQVSADTERSVTFSEVVKEFRVRYSGKVRLKWMFKSDGSGDAAFADARSLIDVCSASTTSASYRPHTCELRVVAGDIIKVTLQGTEKDGQTSSTAFIRKVRLHFDLIDALGAADVMLD